VAHVTAGDLQALKLISLAGLNGKGGVMSEEKQT
jgi:hypothetical protein